MEDFLKPIIDQINKSNSILIVLPPQASGDSLAAGLALKLFLQKLEKESEILSPGGLNHSFRFLPATEQVRAQISLVKSFVIDLSTKKAAVEELNYKKETDRLSFYIKPRSGEFSEEDVSFRTSQFPFDLIICVGVTSLEQLGSFYEQNAELFFETPLANLDHKPYNENYAQFNLVRLNASSTSEIVFDLINSYEAALLDEHIATSLLAGIITETNSFQHARTTPQAFLKASQLVSLGARQQEIIGQLYKNKNLGLLKLWGSVLSKLKQDPTMMLVYSVATQSDIEKAGAEASDVNQIIKEMVSNLGFARIFLFLRELEVGRTEVQLSTITPFNLAVIFAQFKPELLGQVVKFVVPGNSTEAETQVLGLLRQAMSGL